VVLENGCLAAFCAQYRASTVLPCRRIPAPGTKYRAGGFAARPLSTSTSSLLSHSPATSFLIRTFEHSNISPTSTSSLLSHSNQAGTGPGGWCSKMAVLPRFVHNIAHQRCYPAGRGGTPGTEEPATLVARPLSTSTYFLHLISHSNIRTLEHSNISPTVHLHLFSPPHFLIRTLEHSNIRTFPPPPPLPLALSIRFLL